MMKIWWSGLHGSATYDRTCNILLVRLRLFFITTVLLTILHRVATSFKRFVPNFICVAKNKKGMPTGFSRRVGNGNEKFIVAPTVRNSGYGCCYKLSIHVVVDKGVGSVLWLLVFGYGMDSFRS